MNRYVQLGLLSVALFIAPAPILANTDPASAKLIGKFIGSTPRGNEVAAFLGMDESRDVECTWALELNADASGSPTTFKLVGEFGAYSYQKPKTGQKRESKSKEGSWKLAKSMKSPHLRVIELEGGISLLEVSDNVLHFLDERDELLVGDGGYSYSLHRADATEKPGDWGLAMAKPESAITYKIEPLATGPRVYAVFEGRTPYKGIAEQLKLPWDEGNIKAKWRATLYQDEKTKMPSDYKIEGTLFRASPRTGKWRIEKGKEGVWSRVVLEATEGQPELVLLVGSENVLFIADESGKPRVGHGDFSYTLNRRSSTE
jgi:hypothetical protein